MPKYAGVYKHGRGYRGIVYHSVDGKQRNAYTETFTETITINGDRLGPAERARIAREELAKKLRPQRSRGTVTVADWHSLWLATKRADKTSTRHVNIERTRAFVEEFGDEALASIDSDDALAWLAADGTWGRLWMLGGLRVMFGDAVRRGKLASNPFAGLGVEQGKGRKHIVPPTVEQVWALADAAERVWSGHVGASWRALILLLAYTGVRPSEAYALRRVDFDLEQELLHVARQYDIHTREFIAPKNGKPRTIVCTGPARAAIEGLPVNLDAERTLFRTRRGAQLHKGRQHYYWNPIRSTAGLPEMDLYELRHFCASYLLNVCDMPAESVAHQLGHTDGGRLIVTLYGHPSEKVARRRIADALRGAGRPQAPAGSDAEAL